MGDFKLSPDYDLLNSRIHIEDKGFALEEGLLPKALALGTVFLQFRVLSEKGGIDEIVYKDILNTMFKNIDQVEKLTFSSFLDEKTLSILSNMTKEIKKRLMYRSKWNICYLP